MIADLTFYQTPYDLDQREIALKSTDLSPFPSLVVPKVKIDDHPYVKRDIIVPYSDFIIESNIVGIGDNRYFIEHIQTTRDKAGLMVSLVYDPIGSLLSEGDVLTGQFTITPTFVDRFKNPMTMMGLTYIESRQISLPEIPDNAVWVQFTTTKAINDNTKTGLFTYGFFASVSTDPGYPFAPALRPDTSRFFPTINDLMTDFTDTTGLESTAIVSITATRMCPFVYSHPSSNVFSINGNTITLPSSSNTVIYPVSGTVDASGLITTSWQLDVSSLDIRERKFGSFTLCDGFNKSFGVINNPDQQIFCRTMNDPTGMIETFFYLDSGNREIIFATRPAVAIPWLNDNWANYSTSGRLDYDRELLQQNIDINNARQVSDAASSITNGILGGAVTGAMVGSMGGPVGAAGGAIVGLIGSVISSYIGSEITNDATESAAAKLQSLQEKIIFKSPATFVCASSTSALLMDVWNHVHVSIFMPEFAFKSTGIDNSILDYYSAMNGYVTNPGTSYTVAKGPTRGNIVTSTLSGVQKRLLSSVLNFGVILK